MHKDSLRQITDKDLIVFLVACGIDIKQIEKDKKFNRSIIYFEDNENLNDYILKYTKK